MALKKGSKGADVASLQEMLIELKITPAPKVTSNFDDATDAAVKALQKKLGVKDDGVVGRVTLAAIAKGKVLKQGSSGPEVRALQLALGIPADGGFGPKTERAVAAVQVRAGLTEDGEAGSNTWKAILNPKGPVATASPRPPQTRGSSVSNGRAQVGVVSGQDVQLSQNFTLKQLTVTQQPYNNWPTDALIIQRLSGLCVNMLEPLCAEFGGRSKMTVNSGYRSKKVNDAVGSSDGSNHRKGYAADIEIPGIDNRKLYLWIKEKMKYRELILEFYRSKDGPSSGWVHVAYAIDAPNNMRAFTIG